MADPRPRQLWQGDSDPNQGQVQGQGRGRGRGGRGGRGREDEPSINNRGRGRGAERRDAVDTGERDRGGRGGGAGGGGMRTGRGAAGISAARGGGGGGGGGRGRGRLSPEEGYGRVSPAEEGKAVDSGPGASYGHAPRLILGAKMLQESGSGSGSGASASGAGANKGGALLKLVSERFEFVRTQEAMKVLSENTDFTVIAAVGPAGVGKSFILNHVAGLNARNLSSFHSSWSGRPPACRRPFPLQLADTCLDGSHQTVGVDMFVTAERLILLDCQPLLSSSVLLEMVLEGGSVPSGAGRYDEAVLQQSQDLLTFILSVSHLVITVLDTIDPPLLHLLRTAHSFRLPPASIWPPPPPTAPPPAPDPDKPKPPPAPPLPPEHDPEYRRDFKAADGEQALFKRDLKHDPDYRRDLRDPRVASDERREQRQVSEDAPGSNNVQARASSTRQSSPSPAQRSGEGGESGGGGGGQREGGKAVGGREKEEEGKKEEWRAEVVFLVNFASDALMDGLSSRILEETIAAQLHGSPLLLPAASSPPSLPSSPAAAARASGGSARRYLRPVGHPPPSVAPPLCHLFLLPTDERAAAPPSPALSPPSLAVRPSFSVLSERLTLELLALPRPAFPRPISEREWLRGAGQAWEEIQRRRAAGGEG